MAKIHYDELTVGVPSKASSVNYENADGTKESVQSKISKIENDVGKSKQDIEGSQGRNLIPYPYYEGTSKVHNGVTFTVNKDGSVTANGTATNGGATFTIARRHPDALNDLIIPNGIYTASGCPYGGSNETYWVQVTRTHNGTADLLTKEYGQGATFEADGDDYYDDSVNLGFQISIKKGFTVNDLVFKPMLEKGTVAHAYEPTTESNVTLKQNIADLIKIKTYNASFSDDYGLFRLNMNKAQCAVISINSIGYGHMVGVYENTSGDYFALCPTAKGTSMSIEVIYTEQYQLVN